MDVVNLTMNGGFHMQYGVLREFACRDGAQPVRLNAYVAYDLERAKRDPAYRTWATGFHSVLRDLGYMIIIKEFRWFQNEEGGTPGSTPAWTWRWMLCSSPRT